MSAQPTVTIIIPTLNSARVLEQCLLSIAAQRRGCDELELLIVDAGSRDGTRDIACRYGATLLENPLRTAEAGKAVGARCARGEFLAFIDSDNVLVGETWFEDMLRPFEESDVIATEPIRYCVRPSDSYLTRYFAHLGMGDPLSLFLGSYDRYSVLTGRWTDMPVRTVARPGYEKAWLTQGKVPTIGANGFLIRRRVLTALEFGDYLFDVDIIHQAISHDDCAIAKVHCGIVHLFAGDVRSFTRKQRRRITDLLYYRRKGMRIAVETRPKVGGIVQFIGATLLFWPLLWQALQGYVRSGDTAWFFHPAACMLTLYFYGRGALSALGGSGPLSREDWRQ